MLGKRVLKLGIKGPDVGQLQEKLQEFGYDPGPVDEIFGYLTLEALQFFQRDYRLQRDGIAGPEVFALLKQESLPINRRVHLVEQDETLVDISELYNVGPQAFREYKSQIKLYPGQQLVFFDREVWGKLDYGTTSNDSFEKNNSALTGVIIPIKIGESLPQLERSSSLSKIARIDLADQSQITALHQLLTKRKSRKKLLQFCDSLQNKVDGLFFPWEHLFRVDGGRYLKLIRKTKQLLGKKQLLITLDPQMPRWNLLGGLDFNEASKICDQVVIKLLPSSSNEATIDKERYEALIHTILNYVPAYKLLISFPVASYLWNLTNPDQKPQILSHNEAMALVFRKGLRTETDESGGIYYRFYDQQQEKILRIANLDRIKQVITLANRYNLAGLIIDSLGYEDQRLWLNINSYFRIRKKL